MEHDYTKSPKQMAEETGQIERDAAAARETAADAKDVASGAANAGRAYARDAVNSAGKKIDHWKGQFDSATEYCSKFIADEPVRAVWMAAIASSLLTAFVVTSMRSSTRYCDCN
jgi:hypothetical protein